MKPFQPNAQNQAADTLLPLVVSPRVAANMLSCGLTYLYELIAKKEIESYLDGRARKVVVQSLDAYTKRKLEAERGTAPKVATPRRRHAGRDQA